MNFEPIYKIIMKNLFKEKKNKKNIEIENFEKIDFFKLCLLKSKSKEEEDIWNKLLKDEYQKLENIYVN